MQAMTERRPKSSSSIPQRPRPEARRIVAIAGGALLVVLAWLFWPSSYSKVRNLDSRGTAVMAFGDSLTAGYGAAPGADYVSQLSQKTGIEIVNAGVSGDTTEQALARLDGDVLARNPRLVIVGLGGNDFLQGVAISTTETNLRTIVRRIEGAGAMVILLGFSFPSLNVDYQAMYERVAKDEGCLLIPRMLKGILTDPALKSDEIHPNVRGYAIMADRVAGPLTKLLKRADAAR
jgi:acyl-CoA thioesterase I